MEYLELGSTPYEEDCVQVEPSGAYINHMKKECNRYKEQLKKQFPIPNELTSDVYFIVLLFNPF